MIDFVTVLFNDKIELKLLKLQASSFKLVDNNMINSIYIIFNDNLSLFDEFKVNFYIEFINFYPEQLKKKIKLINLIDIGLDFKKSNWFTQQIVKIYISKYLETDYYIVLDAKNHFKQKIKYEDFFSNNKPKLNFNTHNEEMLKYYNNCLNYFNSECPYKNNKNKSLKIQTITPFIFIKSVTNELISYIETKENLPFYKFINDTKKYTEFFLYYSFLVFTNKLHLYTYINKQYVVTIGAVDPKIHLFNSWNNKKPYLESDQFKVISLHRRSIDFLDKEYKTNLLNFYHNNFKDSNIENIIKSILFE